MTIFTILDMKEKMTIPEKSKQKYDFIYLDEFQVTNIVDAMIQENYLK